MGTSTALEHLQVEDDIRRPRIDDMAMEDRSVSPPRSGSSTCSTPGSLTGESMDKREEAKRRRAEEKRRKELEKKSKDAAKKQADKELVAQKKEAEKKERAAKKKPEDCDRIFIPHVAVGALNEGDKKRAEDKDRREAVRQEVWGYQEEEMTKSELRAYYKDMKSKPKGKTPTKQARQFADL